MDYIEYKLLNSLQKNARLTNLELAKQVGLSASPCLRRVKSLEESGVITGYSAIINQNKVHLSVNVFVQVSLERQSEERLQIFEENIMEYRDKKTVHEDFRYVAEIITGAKTNIENGFSIPPFRNNNTPS